MNIIECLKSLFIRMEITVIANCPKCGEQRTGTYDLFIKKIVRCPSCGNVSKWEICDTYGVDPPSIIRSHRIMQAKGVGLICLLFASIALVVYAWKELIAIAIISAFVAIAFIIAKQKEDERKQKRLKYKELFDAYPEFSKTRFVRNNMPSFKQFKYAIDLGAMPGKMFSFDRISEEIDYMVSNGFRPQERYSLEDIQNIYDAIADISRG